MSKENKGFTLIELMITVAIVGILASMGLSSYREYIIRGQISEVISLAEAQKNRLTAAYAETGICPISGSDGFYAANSTQGVYTESVELAGIAPDCIIIATIRSSANPSIAGGIITLRFPSSSLAWECTSSLQQRFLPNACSGL